MSRIVKHQSVRVRERRRKAGGGKKYSRADEGKVIKREAKHGPRGQTRSSERHFINVLESPSFYMRVLFNKFALKPPCTQRRAKETGSATILVWFSFLVRNFRAVADVGRRGKVGKCSIHREGIAALGGRSEDSYGGWFPLWTQAVRAWRSRRRRRRRRRRHDDGGQAWEKVTGSRRSSAGDMWTYTYGNGFTTGALRRGRIQAVPGGQEILDVRSSGVHDAKARDVDGAILDHFALPSVVHYLITAEYTRVLIHGKRVQGGAVRWGAILVRSRDKGSIAAFGALKGQSIVSRKASAWQRGPWSFVASLKSRTGTRVTSNIITARYYRLPFVPLWKP